MLKFLKNWKEIHKKYPTLHNHFRHTVCLGPRTQLGPLTAATASWASRVLSTRGPPPSKRLHFRLGEQAKGGTRPDTPSSVGGGQEGRHEQRCQGWPGWGPPSWRHAPEGRSARATPGAGPDHLHRAEPGSGRKPARLQLETRADREGQLRRRFQRQGLEGTVHRWDSCGLSGWQGCGGWQRKREGNDMWKGGPS